MSRWAFTLGGGVISRASKKYMYISLHDGKWVHGFGSSREQKRMAKELDFRYRILTKSGTIFVDCDKRSY